MAKMHIFNIYQSFLLIAIFKFTLIFSNEEIYKLIEWKTLKGERTKLMAHRGEKFLIPEHTFGAYEIAALNEGDYLEPDLVLTKDNIPVCSHDLYFNNGGVRDYFRNYTWDEFKALNLTVRQANSEIRPQYFNNIFQVITFEEFLNQVKTLNTKLNKTLGIIPEIKEPKLHNDNDPNNEKFEDIVFDILSEHGYIGTEKDPEEKLLIQSFELDSLKYLRTKSENLSLVFLVGYENKDALTPENITEISKYVNHLSVNVRVLLDDVLETPVQDIVEITHENGMKFGLWTIPDSREFSVPSNIDFKLPFKVGENENSKTLAMFYAFERGVDGIFIENVAESREILIKYIIYKQAAAADNSPCDHNSVSNLTCNFNAIFLILFFYLIFKN